MNLINVAKEKFSKNNLKILTLDDVKSDPFIISSKDLFVSFINHRINQENFTFIENGQSDMLLMILRTIVEDKYFEENVVGVILKDPSKDFEESNIDDIVFSSSTKLIMAHAIKNVVGHVDDTKSTDEYTMLYLIAPNTLKHYFSLHKDCFKELISLEESNFKNDLVSQISNFASFIDFKERKPKHILLPLKLEVLKFL